MVRRNRSFEQNKIRDNERKKFRYANDPIFRQKILDYKRKHRNENKEMYARRAKEWALSNPETVKAGKHAYQIRIRNEALNIVGRGILRCTDCGIDKSEILEINHKNGGGRKELVNKRGNIQYTPFLRAIISGKRSIDDLNILCKICNQIHYVKLKFGIDWMRHMVNKE